MLTDLGEAFDAAGLPWVPVGYSPLDPTGAPDWTTRGRPASSGPFEPTGVLCHHTASPPGTTPQGDLNVILAGNSEAPGPISQLYIGRDAVLYVVAAGRANHGGRGQRPGIDGACTDMNAALVGIEAGNDGLGERWSDAMVDTYGRCVAALCAHYGWAIDSQVFLHATTGPACGNHKIDPAGPWREQPELPGGGAGTWHLETWRAWCASFATGGPPAPRPEGDDVARCIIHVDASQPAGSDGYYRYYAVWNWSGPWRYHLPSELAVQQAVYENTGDADVFATALGNIIRVPAWVTPVGDLGGYGAVAGADPGDV
jgi:hypothetical protein